MPLLDWAGGAGIAEPYSVESSAELARYHQLPCSPPGGEMTAVSKTL